MCDKGIIRVSPPNGGIDLISKAPLADYAPPRAGRAETSNRSLPWRNAPSIPAGTMDNPENRHMNKWVLAILLGAVALFMYFSIIWKTY